MKRFSIDPLAIVRLTGIAVRSFVLLAVALTGCQNQHVKDRELNTVSFWDWAMLSTLAAKSGKKTFPSRIHVELINGHALVGGPYDGRVSCSYGRCRLHPGKHTVGIVYTWSPTETLGERKARDLGHTLLIPLAIYGGEIPVFPNDDSRCENSVSLVAQANKRYVLNVVHITQTERPEEVQILDAESGSIVASAVPTC